MNGLQVGEVVAERYRVDEFVGAGGMAAVYRATDQTLGRTVAVKVFLQGTAGRGDEARRVSETRLLASLNHHALVTLHDAHLPEDGLAFLVMEYIDGGSLDDRLRGGPLSPRDAAGLAGELAEALHVVHAAGIIHRDVKPSNILLRSPLTPDGAARPTLADFGIAYLVDTTRLTAPGTAIGTAAYLAPEQVRGAPPTTASDIYSLGLVLIEALTGQRAFAQQTPIEAIAARLSMQPEIPNDIGYAWRSLLTAMTTLDPEQRPTALEVAARVRMVGSAADDAATTVAAPALTAIESRTGDGRAAQSLSADDSSATKVLPAATATATRAETQAAGATSGASVARRRRTVTIWVGASVALAVAIVLGILVWTSNPPTDADQPDLPQIGEPLDTHLQDLLEAVTP